MDRAEQTVLSAPATLTPNPAPLADPLGAVLAHVNQFLPNTQTVRTAIGLIDYINSLRTRLIAAERRVTNGERVAAAQASVLRELRKEVSGLQGTVDALRIAKGW